MKSRHYALKAELRDQAGKGVARALRRENKVPAVIYGDGKEPVSISLPNKEVGLEYNKGHMYTSLCDLELDGKKHSVLARDVQLHPVTDVVLHVDFIRVTPKTKIRVHVPVKFINEDACPGLTRSKGTLTVARHEVDLICTATDIPDHIDVDLTGVTVSHPIKLSAVKLPAGTKSAITDRDVTIGTIAPPRHAVEEDAPAEGAAEGEAAAAADKA